jgi:integrase/recombinase XerD
MNKASRVHISGPLARYAPGFREELDAQGYTDSSAASQLHLMAHLSRWMTEQDLDAGGLTCARVERFVEVRCSEGRSVHRSPRALAGLLGFLRRSGAVPPASSSTPCTPGGRLLERYRVYLVQERGLAATTVGGYTDIAGRFVAGRPSDGPGLASVSVAEVREFVTNLCVGRSPGAARNVVSAVRSWLGFLHLEGVISRPLGQSVPAGPVRAGNGLPRAVDLDAVEAMLRSCDRDTGQGRRDYAVLLTLARLGLRAGEVATVGLDDVNWRAGQITVRGKGGSHDQLPLPTDVGKALADYLRDGRPDGRCREVFVRLPAPHRALGASGITQIVYRACDRAGLARIGAHRLRHATATGMLAAGAPLSEIGQVMRHHSRQTTGIYAKVDHHALRGLALPWPGGQA